MARRIGPEISRLPSMPSIGSLLRLYKLKSLKHLSQVFLMEPRLIEKIVKAAGTIHNGFVCEVGPGPGGITRSILRRSPKQVLLIEKDIRFKPMLELLVQAVENDCKVDIKYADILGLSLKRFIDESFKKEWEDSPPNIHVIGNLPFNVSTPLIIKWLMDISARENIWSYGRARLTLTFQKEVAERMAAPILSKQRCRLSVVCQNWCKVDYKFKIPGRAFIPPPEVDVGIVVVEPLVKPVVELPFYMFNKVTTVMFNTRQKYIRRGVQCLFPEILREELTKEVFQKTELNPESRSFQLSVEEFGKIAHVYKEICDRDPRILFYDFRGPKEEKELCWQEDAELDSNDPETISSAYT